MLDSGDVHLQPRTFSTSPPAPPVRSEAPDPDASPREALRVILAEGQPSRQMRKQQEKNISRCYTGAAPLQPRRRASAAQTKGHSTGPSRTLADINGGFDGRWEFNAQFPDLTKAAEGTLLGPVTEQNP